MQPTASTKRLVLVAAILGTTVVTVDSTVVNVALPAIAVAVPLALLVFAGVRDVRRRHRDGCAAVRGG